ncbi:hypothetical protein [Mesorhizobium sp. M0041]|uniref:hypothetical protein n=1 Tax=Mesorhizobium sp. M0041 TaxID=2956856 RepID=UPI00333B89D2
MCPVCFTRKNAFLAGNEIGAENWALLSSVLATCGLNDINPAAYLAETLDAIINGPPRARSKCVWSVWCWSTSHR